MIKSSSLVSSFGCMQIVKYYFVGVGINAAGYLLFLWLISVGFEHKLVASVLYVLGVGVSFLLNRKLVFDSAVTLRSSIKMLFLMIFSGYVINISILLFFVDEFGFGSGIVQLISVFIVSIYFFFFNKYFVHRVP